MGTLVSIDLGLQFGNAVGFIVSAGIADEKVVWHGLYLVSGFSQDRSLFERIGLDGKNNELLQILL